MFRILGSVRLAVCILIVAAAFAARAEEAAPWKSEVSFGYDLNRGNSDTDCLRAAAKTSRKAVPHVVLAEASYSYGQTDDEKSVDNARAVGDYNYLFTDRFYLNVKAEYSYDAIADVDYRVLVGPPSLGYFFVKNEKTGLNGELGAAYIWEKVAGVSSDAPTLRLKQRLDHAFNDAVSIFQLVEYTPELEAGNRDRRRAEVGLDSALTRSLHLRLLLVDRYDSEPAPGVKDNDFSMNLMLVLKI